MARQPRIISSTGVYHIIQRGINRSTLFRDNKDFHKYIELLIRYGKEGAYEILAYCLMKNHIHLLINLYKDPPGLFVKKISVSYSYYFNKKYERVGHLFQNRFKSTPVEDDSYLLTLIKYIHNNPEKAGICPAKEYKWSSYEEYINEKKIVNTDYLFKILGGKEMYIHSLSEEDLSFYSEYENMKKTDQECLKILQSADLDNISIINSFSRNGRAHLIETLLEKGISTEQLSRITGLSRSTIARYRQKSKLK